MHHWPQDGNDSHAPPGTANILCPEACAALDYADFWEDESLHRATTKIISQSIAEIIGYDEFMQASVASGSR
jgi:hypothetical protein